MRALFLLLALGGLACESSSPSSGPDPATSAAASSAPLPDRDPALAKKLVEQGAVLLDVRTEEEFDDEHLDGAAHIPVQQLKGKMGKVKELTGGAPTKPIVVYCASGARAGTAKEMLTEAGHTKVTNLGGMDDWPDT